MDHKEYNWRAMAVKNGNRIMGKPGVYHRNGPTWLHDGRALCGKDTTRAGWESWNPQKRCKRCERKLA